MHNIAVIFFLILSLTLPAQNREAISRLKDLDKHLPGISAQLFAVGKVSTPFTDWGITISPGCDEIYYTVSLKNKTRKSAIVGLKWINGKWNGPETVSFSGVYDDVTPVMSADGKKIIFSSRRPVPGDTSGNFNLWCVEKINGTWDQPYVIRELFNCLPNLFFPSMAENGDLYFNSSIPGTQGSTHIYCSRFVDGKYMKPEPLTGEIITETGEYCPYISPDQKWMIIEMVDQPNGFGGGDMYITKKNSDGSWARPVNLGNAFNSGQHDCYPILTPGKDYLIFMSCRTPEFFSRTDQSNYNQLQWMAATYNDEPFDFYWISAKALNEFLK